MCRYVSELTYAYSLRCIRPLRAPFWRAFVYVLSLPIEDVVFLLPTRLHSRPALEGTAGHRISELHVCTFGTWFGTSFRWRGTRTGGTAITKKTLFLDFGGKKTSKISQCKKVHKPSRTYPGEGGCPEKLKKSTYDPRF